MSQLATAAFAVVRRRNLTTITPTTTIATIRTTTKVGAASLASRSFFHPRRCSDHPHPHPRHRCRLRLRQTVINNANNIIMATRAASTSKTSNKTTSSSSSHSDHYESHTVDSYEQAYFYEPGEYMEYLVEKTRGALGWTTSPNNNNDSNNPTTITTTSSSEPLILLDIGGGTGNFAQALIDKQQQQQQTQTQPFPQNVHIRVIDPFLEPTTTRLSTSTSPSTSTSSDSPSPPVSFIKAKAEDFMIPIDDDYDDDNNVVGSSDDTPSSSSSSLWWWRKKNGYHQILLKEVVHHFRNEDRIAIFRGMYDGCITTTKKTSSNNNGKDNKTTNGDGDGQQQQQQLLLPSVLIITRPQVDIDYPLWDEAREVWRNNQPSVKEIEDDLHQAGFQHTSSTIQSYPCSIALDRWQEMVRTRFWSTFSHFDDDELEYNALTVIPEIYKDRIDDDGNLHFEDRLVFIQGYL